MTSLGLSHHNKILHLIIEEVRGGVGDMLTHNTMFSNSQGDS